MNEGSGFLDSTGVWGKCSIFYAEFWGILDGLSLLIVNQCKRVLIQTNNLEVFKAIQDPDSKSSCSTLVRRIRQLLDSVRNWRLDHIPKEANKDADQMARMTFEREYDLHLFTESPFVDFV